MTFEATEYISAEFPFEKKKVQALDGEIAYVDTSASAQCCPICLRKGTLRGTGSDRLWRLDWESLPQPMAENFRLFRDPILGRNLLINKNLFIEKVLPFSIVCQLSEKEMNVYRQPFLELSSRKPLWRFPNEILIEGELADVWGKAQTYLAWLFETELPKLFFWVTSGGTISEERAVEFIKKLRNTNSVYLGRGVHFLQEDHPHRIGREVAKWLPSTAEEQ
ncbi:hypothetical protein FOTG_15892 [Fusarium oxysporum f. sp. vasinfectum 25433]|uniref:Uncharacterized protein n=1 Tax=Fusarium oxysporum f. sp. vasinfectum 25433 TaxID=1089449 RepID=X0M586_FUSOX|nr:hypothetical protein FOTG_15892 [Fusarium oxysporum f. sp. vasinfectum 25433]